MATNLSGSITDTDNIIYPTNDDVLTGERPYRVVIESEVLHVRAAEYIGSATEATRWTVDRGQEGTTAASHAAGTAVTAAGAYGAGGGGGVTVDNQSDPPAAVTTLIAPGADVSTPGSADLSMAEGLQRIRLLGPFNIEPDTPDISTTGAVLTTLPDGCLVLTADIEVKASGWFTTDTYIGVWIASSDLGTWGDAPLAYIATGDVAPAANASFAQLGYNTARSQLTGTLLNNADVPRFRTINNAKIIAFGENFPGDPGAANADVYVLIAEPA